MANDARPHLVIIGGGFAGLYCARAAARLPVRITIIDRKNHHTFQPLLYQVASAVLSPGDIASPIRGIVHRYANIEVLLDEVTGFDLDRRVVVTAHGEIAYRYLVVATGATHSYFSHPEWATLAPGLKTVEDALEIRRRILLAFELAERRALHGEPPRPINFVVIGAGTTGVELAGALADISRNSLARDYKAINPSQTRVILLEGASRVLPTYPEELSRSAERQLVKLGVEVRTGAQATAIEPGRVWVGDEQFPAAVTLWGAGVAASPLGRMLGAQTDAQGRAMVELDLSVAGHPEVFAIGDLASINQANGKPVPGVAPAAMQMGSATARNLGRLIAGKPTEPFRYRDKGSLATIGRAAAVADFGKLRISGAIAWLMWLFIHIFFLIGFRNRVFVMLQWAWAYLTQQQPTRLITGSTDLPGD